MTAPTKPEQYAPIWRLNVAYSERMIAVRALVSLALRHSYKCGIGWDDSTTEADKDIGWGNVLYVELPEGQMSWHISPHDWFMFKDLPKFDGKWDGTSHGKDLLWAEKLYP